MTDHDLNKLLAEVAGVDVRWNNSFHEQRWYEMTNDCIPRCTNRVWTPLTDANQMALVKAGLWANGLETQTTSDARGTYVWLIKNRVQEYFAEDPHELRAFALAVVAMQKGTDTPRPTRKGEQMPYPLED